MATDDMGIMRECRTDCAWLVREGDTAFCAVTSVAVSERHFLLILLGGDRDTDGSLSEKTSGR